MEINFKTLDKQKFSLFIYGSEYVEDLINKVGNTIGKDNLYRLIHAGRLLKKKNTCIRIQPVPCTASYIYGYRA